MFVPVIFRLQTSTSNPQGEMVYLSNFFCHGENLFVQVETTAPPPKRKARKRRSFRSVYMLWLAEKPAWPLYQRTQAVNRFSWGGIVSNIQLWPLSEQAGGQSILIEDYLAWSLYQRTPPCCGQILMGRYPAIVTMMVSRCWTKFSWWLHRDHKEARHYCVVSIQRNGHSFILSFYVGQIFGDFIGLYGDRMSVASSTLKRHGILQCQ
jgi:hypothetical protein